VGAPSRAPRVGRPLFCSPRLTLISPPPPPLQAKQAEIQAAQRAIGNVFKLGR